MTHHGRRLQIHRNTAFDRTGIGKPVAIPVASVIPEAIVNDQQHRPHPETASAGRIIDDCRHDLAMGAVLGALIGDAAGPRWSSWGARRAQKKSRKPWACAAAASGTPPAAGHRRLRADPRAAAGPGRTAPTTSTGPPALPPVVSRPFDIGNATANALGTATRQPRAGRPHRPPGPEVQRGLPGQRQPHAGHPLGVWSARVSVERPSPPPAPMPGRPSDPGCQWSTAACVVAIRHLTLKADDHRSAFEAARSILPAGEGDEVRRWLDDATAGRLPPFHPQAGFVRIAFTHAFHHLQQRTLHAGAAGNAGRRRGYGYQRLHRRGGLLGRCGDCRGDEGGGDGIAQLSS